MLITNFDRLQTYEKHFMLLETTVALRNNVSLFLKMTVEQIVKTVSFTHPPLKSHEERNV